MAHPDLQQRRKDKMTDIWEVLTDAQRRAEASAKRIKPVPKQGTLTAWLKPVPKCKPPWHKPVQPSVHLSKDMVVNPQGKRGREQKKARTRVHGARAESRQRASQGMGLDIKTRDKRMTTTFTHPRLRRCRKRKGSRGTRTRLQSVRRSLSVSSVCVSMCVCVRSLYLACLRLRGVCVPQSGR